MIILVIRPWSPHVSSTIDQPGKVEGQHVSGYNHVPGFIRVLSKVDGKIERDEKAAQKS